MLDKARPMVQPILLRVAKPFARIHPNWITLIGFIFGVAFFCTMRRGYYPLSLLMLVGVSIDSLDGTVARMSGKASQFGAFFDSSMDRFTDVFLVAAFAASGFISWELAMATAVMGLMISYTRGTAEKLTANKIKFAVGLMERPERLLTIALATLAVVFWPAKEFGGVNIVELLFWLLLILSTLTVAQRFWAGYQKLEK